MQTIRHALAESLGFDNVARSLRSLFLFLLPVFVRFDGYNSNVLVCGTRYLAAKDPLEQNL